MLSYKLKHLCSRVIASLSAVGLFSITGTSKAEAYDFSESVQIYGSRTFTAAYEKDATITCAGADNLAVSGVVSGLNGNGVLTCSYVLKKGFVYYAGVSQTGTCLAAGVSSAPSTKYFNSGTSCTQGTYSGVLISEVQSGGLASYPLLVQTMSGEIGSGYAGAYVVSVTGDSSGNASLDTSLLGYAPVQVTFNCKGTAGGSFASSSTGYAITYSGGSITLPGSGNCVAPDGYTFSGWNG